MHIKYIYFLNIINMILIGLHFLNNQSDKNIHFILTFFKIH